MNTITHPTKNEAQIKAADAVFDSLAIGELGNLLENKLGTFVSVNLESSILGAPIICATIKQPNGEVKTLFIRVSVE